MNQSPVHPITERIGPYIIAGCVIGLALLEWLGY